MAEVSQSSRQTHLLENFADELFGAFQSKRLERRSSSSISRLDLDQAYTVQSLLIEKRIASGERPVGYKVGCTSRAVREQFGLERPVRARLISPHVYAGDTCLSWEDYVDCAVEAELVFRIGRDVRDLDGLSNWTRIAEAIEYVSPGIEVHNCKFWYGNPTTQELIASNAIHACLVVGNQKTLPGTLDFELEGIGLFLDGELVASAISAETMGSPLNSLAWLAKELIARGDFLKAGDLVIPGSAVQLVPVEKGSVVRSKFTRCGSVRAEFV